MHRGHGTLATFAQTLLEIAKGIPGDVPWVLRVDGHTDRVPIASVRYPSNWELSTARALSVVKYLVSQGVPATRLAATGLPRVEAASFVRRVPQMEGAEDVFAALPANGTTYAALVLNRKGLDRALAAGAREIHYAYPVLMLCAERALSKPTSG